MGRSKSYTLDAFDRKAIRATKHELKSKLDSYKLSSYNDDAFDDNLFDDEEKFNQVASPQLKEYK